MEQSNIVSQVLKLKEMDDINIDIDLKLPPFGYQKVCSAFMFMVKRCFNLSKAGSGKTIHTLGYFKLLQDKEKIKNPKYLVVAISSTLYQWRDETIKFTDLNPIVLDGTTAQRKKILKNFIDDDHNVLIINYTKILHDFDQLMKIQFNSVVFDEVTSLKDQSAQTFKMFSFLTKKVPRVVGLTATPINTNLEDFYNMSQVIGLKHLPRYEEFRDRFLETKPVKVNKGRRSFIIQTVVGSKNIPEFRKLMEPYFVLKENNTQDYLKIKMNVHKYPTRMSREQISLCSTVRQEALRQRFSKDEELNALKVYSDFIKISCAPSIYGEDYSSFSPKAIDLTKLIKELGEKTVVFAKFIEFHKIIKENFDAAGISYCSITGEESIKQKDESKKQFVEQDTDVMLLTGAGKFGLNLQVAHNFVFVDVPYTPTDVFQYIARVLRTGQKAPEVNVYFIYSENTVEEDLFNTLYKRQKEIDEFFGTDDAKLFEFIEKVNVVDSFLQRDYKNIKSYEEG